MSRLTEQVGNEAAQAFLEQIEDVEDKILSDTQNSVKYLATKEAVARIETQIVYVKGELKEEISKIEARLSGNINGLQSELTEKIKGG